MQVQLLLAAFPTTTMKYVGWYLRGLLWPMKMMTLQQLQQLL
jgi:hypothetical protein